MFADGTTKSGLANCRGTGFGTVMADFDCDGRLDLVVANGGVRRPAGSSPDPDGKSDKSAFWADYSQPNQILGNAGKGRFVNLSEKSPSFSEHSSVSRGLACGDINGDGAMDVLVTCIDGPARLYLNVAERKGHWLMVRAIDPKLGRDAYGAEITVRAGKRRWMRWINPGHGYLCSNDWRAHFGLGDAKEVDAIEVVWPDGTLEEFGGCKADQVVVLRKGEGTPSSERKTP